MSESLPPPAGIPTSASNNNLKYAALALFFLLAGGGLVAWKLMGQNAPEPKKEAAVIPSIIPTISHTEEAIPLPDEPATAQTASPGTKTIATASNGCELTKCSGALTPDLETALSMRARAARKCYERELATDPSLTGKIAIKVKIGTSGAVCSTAIAENNISAASVAPCSANVFRGSFPAPRGGCIETTIPINFQHR